MFDIVRGENCLDLCTSCSNCAGTNKNSDFPGMSKLEWIGWEPLIHDVGFDVTRDWN